MADWLDISQNRGSGCTTISITAATLTDLYNRMIQLKVKGTMGTERFVDVYQRTSYVQDQYITFSTTGTSNTLELETNYQPTLFYSYDTVNWLPWDYSALSFSNGHNLYMAGLNYDGLHSSRFVITGAATSVSGNIMTLIDGNNPPMDIPVGYCFTDLFSQNQSLVSVDRNFLPATGLTNSCYMGMFQYCGSLVSVPDLPATELMDSCYYAMFTNCESLVTAPALPATTLAKSCYSWMFASCFSLVNTPDLPALSIDDRSYAGMFTNDSNVSTIRCNAVDFYDHLCADNWLRDTSLSGVFYANMDAFWSRDASGIPATWNRRNY